MEEKQYKRDQVVNIINSVMDKVRAPEPDRQLIFDQVKALKETLETLREDISSSNIRSVPYEYVPNATDELDAVVLSTEEATETIMSCCETLETAVEQGSSDMPNIIESQVTKIYEACSFQDLTGQRISKVTKALKEIEQQTNTILEALQNSFTLESKLIENDPDLQDSTEGTLLNGPALPQNKVSQDEIDKLLESF